MIHYIMEGEPGVKARYSGKEQEKALEEHAALKKTFKDYLRHFKEVSLDQKDAAQGGAKLEYIYVDTFHQLDRDKINDRWQAWVETMCKRAGINWTVPAEKKEDE
jgi:predicted RNA-binding protein Jag